MTLIDPSLRQGEVGPAVISNDATFPLFRQIAETHLPKYRTDIGPNGELPKDAEPTRVLLNQQQSANGDVRRELWDIAQNAGGDLIPVANAEALIVSEHRWPKIL